MAGSKEIKRRIKSVKSTKKITKAMELVAASKMKRAVAATLASRTYAEYSWEVLVSISKGLDEITHPLFVKRPTKKTLLILITSNRGLCGAYNAQVIRKSLTFLKKRVHGENVDIMTVGKKGDVAMCRVGEKICSSFTDLPDNISLANMTPISKLALHEYSAGNYDKVLVAYTDFVSAMTQAPNIKQVLPISKTELKEFISGLEEIRDSENPEKKPNHLGNDKKTNYLIEGDQNKLLGSLAEKLVKMQIYQMLLESNASEQSSRMIAMKNASEAAGEMIDDLTLVFNKSRQASITQEISEISAGMASVS
ncbi:MAG: ATP synthase F1 subunit gamma [Candidatus Taylorbacteria bacterium]|nr:ATP synthase F1 subunit gamma [Candidatus Taylorbacteria bacterium]